MEIKCSILRIRSVLLFLGKIKVYVLWNLKTKVSWNVWWGSKHALTSTTLTSLLYSHWLFWSLASWSDQVPSLPSRLRVAAHRSFGQSGPLGVFLPLTPHLIVTWPSSLFVSTNDCHPGPSTLFVPSTHRAAYLEMQYCITKLLACL